jgi:hypothetical protein
MPVTKHSPFAAIIAGLAASLAGGCTHSPVSANLSSPAAVVWRIDNTASVGGLTPEVLGAPKTDNGPGGKTLVFDGAHDALVLPSIPIEGWREFTIEVLFNPAADGDAEQRFFHIEDSAMRRGLLELRLTKEGRWSLDTFLLDGPSSKALLDLARQHAAGHWYWVALRYDGKHIASFVNGVPELEGDVTFGPMTTGRTSVGVRLNKVNWFKGAIGEVRFTPAALLPAQLQRTGD